MKMPAVILGAAVHKYGEPSPTLLRRTLAAVLLVKQGMANKIIASGGVGKYQPAEAIVMREIATREGINDADIIVDAKSTSTIETALNCSKILKELGYQRAWIVTDKYHMSRCMLAFKVFGVHGKAAPPDNELSRSKFHKMTKARAREVFACAAGAPKLLYLYAIQLWKGAYR